jgi:hypothetical protein
LDIVIPELKLAIEFNRKLLSFGAELINQFGYHEMKTTMCESVDYCLIHIWEDEWKTNKEKIKQYLITKFKKLLY